VAERWYLEIAGIDGESTAKGYEKTIEVLAWSWGVNQSGYASGGGGSGSGKASFREFDFVVVISKASPELVLACAQGKHFPSAVLTGVRGGGKSVAFLQYELADVMVTSVHHADDEDDVPVEEFSLNYQKFEITYTTQKASGKPGTPVHAGWDLATNKQI
jgi:type VI secretion system secreted protein Hcp